MDMKALPERWWHVRLRKQSAKEVVYLNDLSLAELTERIIRPWHDGQPFTVEGVIFKSSSDVEEVQIVVTRETQKVYADRHNEEMRRRNIGDMVTNRKWLPFKSGEDYTDRLLFPAPQTRDAVQAAEERPLESNKVFIVHGHDDELKAAAARLVSQCGLDPIILHEQPNKGRTIIEKFSDFSDVGFAIVLLSADDELKDGSCRARQNVILELGYFLGKLGRTRVAVLYQNADGFDIPSDFAGVIYTEYDGGGWRFAIAKELKAAGFDIDLNRL